MADPLSKKEKTKQNKEVNFFHHFGSKACQTRLLLRVVPGKLKFQFRVSKKVSLSTLKLYVINRTINQSKKSPRLETGKGGENCENAQREQWQVLEMTHSQGSSFLFIVLTLFWFQVTLKTVTRSLPGHSFLNLCLQSSVPTADFNPQICCQSSSFHYLSWVTKESIFLVTFANIMYSI